MATLDQLLDGQRLDRITEQARDVHFGRFLLTVLAGLLYGVGWIAAKTFGGLWLALAWTAVAVKVGWQEARKQEPKPRR